jgi:phage terminase large subunit
MKLNPKLKNFWRKKARLKILYGGRASSKTHDAGGMAVYLARHYTVKFLCTRQFQNRISESVYTVLKQKIEEAGWTDEFTITNNRIIHNTTKSEFIFLGLWRNIDEIKSLEGIDVCWLEEAHSVTKEQWDILEPTIRKEGSEIWLIFNPRLRTDFVYKNFVIDEQPNSIVQKINYTDNPFLSDTMLELIESKKDDDDFRHIYLGEPKTSATNNLFNYEELEKAMDDTYIEGWDSGVKVYGLDVARYGDDSTVFCERNGLVVEPLKVKTKQSTVEIASWITYEYNQSTPDAVVVDTVGLGAGVYDQLATAGVYSIDGNAGMKADDDRYFNKRSEMYFNLKEAIKKGLKLPKDDGLLEELMSITYTFNEKGQMRLESKDKIKETLGRSPDKSDAVALTFFTTIIPKQMEEQFYSTSYSNGAW